MKLSDALSGVRTLGIETAPFIYFVEKHPTYVDRMQAIFQLTDFTICPICVQCRPTSATISR